ncbi:DUF6629 family protein [Bdellovibrio sp. HCB337]|uniref:DUF6629 family protein n=1 Tax=Bdellovibrio sp. HCB337 TaxID=3394358 RepID=UPI0039A76F0C
MCYSASVSYGSAAVLMATGAVTTFKNNSKQQRMVAAIPFLFGLQQVAEGIVWQSMGHESANSLRDLGVFMFLTFALVIWPTWLPWSFYPIETNTNRKRILKVIGVTGVGVSILVASVLYSINVKAYIAGHSLAYAFPGFQRSWPANIEALLYFTATVVPFFISSLRTIKIAGYLVFGSMLLAKAINRETETSVWCFFAALISFYIAVNVLWLQKGKLS